MAETHAQQSSHGGELCYFFPVRTVTPSKLEALGQSSAAKGPSPGKNSSRRGQEQPPTTESVLSKAFFSTDGEVAHLYGLLLI